MSHFIVIVAGEDRDRVDDKMLPYHEYECTGIEEYLEWVDETEKYLKNWEEAAVDFVLMPDGTIESEAAHYHVEPCDDPQRPWVTECRALRLPEGAETVSLTRVDALELMSVEHAEEFFFKDFEDFVEGHWGGEPIPDQPGRYGRKTNPNARWDWYQVGGRWTGLFPLKEFAIAELRRTAHTRSHNLEIGKDTSPKTREQLGVGNGVPGLMTKHNRKITHCDYAPKGLIDFERMRDNTRQRELALYDMYQTINVEWGDKPISTDQREATRERYESWVERYPKVKEVYPTLDSYVRWRLFQTSIWAHEDEDMTEDEKVQHRLSFADVDDLLRYHLDRERFTETIDDTLSWAFIDSEGNWIEKAKMGWWATHGDVDASYRDQFWSFIEALDDDMVVWAIDAHI